MSERERETLWGRERDSKRESERERRFGVNKRESARTSQRAREREQELFLDAG